ncbi:MAG: alkaline phosphatase family protein, partial [Burkholderiaceae bacterium]
MKFIDSACAVLWTGLVLSCNAQAIPAEGSGAAAGPHNVVLFVADGLRAEMVRADTAPTMYAIRQYGVWFKNSHSLFPTFTTPNASALATGHYLGDTGDFGNVIYTGYGVTSANGSDTPFLESDPVLGEVNAHHGGNYLDEASVLAVAHARGYLTAAVGKLGPVSIQDVAARDGATTLVVDDMTGRPGGLPLGAGLLSALQAARLDAVAPGRGANGDAGDAHRPGTLSANVEQQKYFVDVTTRALLPLFKATGKPFVLVFWSRDPDGTQHNQGDSLGQLTPGINGPSSLAGIRNADSNLAALLGALESLGLAKTTDVVVTADHGFSTISKQSRTSPAAQASYADVPPGQLPPGFLAIDLALALHQPLYDPDAKGAKIDLAAHQHPSRADGLIGADPARPEIVVAANGGSDLIYLPGPDPVALARQVVTALFDQDYVSGVFVDDSLGSIPGTLALSAINLRG